jgi:hypothetical protein
MGKIVCEQTKCSYYGTEQCPICSECGCETGYIDEDCDICWNCMKDSGFIRNEGELQQETEVILVKEV